MRTLASNARWQSPSEVLAAIVESRRMLEVAVTGPRMRDSWRRLRFVVDQARAWAEGSRGGLRAYVAWVSAQARDSARVAESVLPELDVDAVRIMTIHASKGLEFPVVVMSGMTSASRRQGGVQVLWPSEGGYAVRMTATAQTGDFGGAQPIDEQMDAAERLRLLYVAATRARDHLVVSVHRKAGGKGTSAHTLVDAGALDGAPVERFARGASGGVDLAWGGVPAGQEDPPLYEDWLETVTRARTASGRAGSIVASGLEGTEPEVVLGEPDAAPAGAHKGPRNLDLPPWSKGRYGSAIGRAVHGALQSIDLADGSGLDVAVDTQALAEGVTSHRELVEQLVRSALTSDLVRRAAAREHWKEMYVGAVNDDGDLVEGYIDLVYRDGDSALVIVDYKTDAIPTGAVETRVAYYRPQMQAYVDCLRRATSAQVRAELLFLAPSAALARSV